MIRKIAISLIFVSLLIAVFISVSSNGEITYISIGPSFYAFMKSVALKSINFDIEIPHIPELPTAESVVVSDQFLGFVRGLFAFINFLVKVLNVIVDLFNTIIKIFEFIWFIISDFNTFKQALLDGADSSSNSFVAVPIG